MRIAPTSDVDRALASLASLGPWPFFGKVPEEGGEGNGAGPLREAGSAVEPLFLFFVDQ
jgi:hypothetical protein